MLCCNCHAQTPTFRNKKRNKESSPTGEIRQTHAAQTRAPLTTACQFKSGVGHTLCVVCFESCSSHKAGQGWWDDRVDFETNSVEILGLIERDSVTYVAYMDYEGATYLSNESYFRSNFHRNISE